MPSPSAALRLNIGDDHRSQLLRRHLARHILRGRDAVNMNNVRIHLANPPSSMRDAFPLVGRHCFMYRLITDRLKVSASTD